MTANCTETSGSRPDVFLFPDPPGATAAPASRPIVPIVPIVPTVSSVSSVLGASSVSGRTERTDRTERRDMPRIGPFVLARSIDGSSFFL